MLQMFYLFFFLLSAYVLHLSYFALFSLDCGFCCWRCLLFLADSKHNQSIIIIICFQSMFSFTSFCFLNNTHCIFFFGASQKEARYLLVEVLMCVSDLNSNNYNFHLNSVYVTIFSTLLRYIWAYIAIFFIE